MICTGVDFTFVFEYVMYWFDKLAALIDNTFTIYLCGFGVSHTGVRVTVFRVSPAFACLTQVALLTGLLFDPSFVESGPGQLLTNAGDK